MKKTVAARKLNLQRETVMALHKAELETVQGGSTPSVIFTASVRFCAPAAEAIRQSAIRSCFTCRCR